MRIGDFMTVRHPLTNAGSGINHPIRAPVPRRAFFPVPEGRAGYTKRPADIAACGPLVQYAYWFGLSREPRGPRKRWGMGVRHALFPRLLTFGAQLHPSSVAGCQFPDAALALHGRLHAVFGSAAEPVDGVTTAGLSGETSQPGPRTPAGVLIPDPVRIPLGQAASAPQTAGSASHLLVSIVCPAPRVLSLSPQVASYFPAGRPVFFTASRLFGSYCNSAVTAGLPAPLLGLLNP